MRVILSIVEIIYNSYIYGLPDDNGYSWDILEYAKNKK